MDLARMHGYQGLRTECVRKSNAFSGRVAPSPPAQVFAQIRQREHQLRGLDRFRHVHIEAFQERTGAIFFPRDCRQHNRGDDRLFLVE